MFFVVLLAIEKLNIFIFPLNGARDIISLTNYCQLIRKLTYKEVQIEKINEDKQLSDITTF